MSDFEGTAPEPSGTVDEGPWQTWVHELRQRLEDPTPHRLEEEHIGRPASVLVPLYVHAGELWVVLTRRSEDLMHHGGQVAFPGGGREPGEDEWDAALRETQEEIGLEPGRILKLGMLDERYAEVSDYRIQPCVGVVPFPLETTPNPDEIDEIFTIPLLQFTDVRVIEERLVEWRGQERQVRVYHVGRHAVWGLTARIMQNLIERLGFVEATEV